MRHLTEGTLRRMYDDPHAVDEATSAHLARCESCQIRLRQVAEEARHAAELMQVSGVTVDAQRAYRRLRPRLEEPRRGVLGGFSPSLGLRGFGGWRKPVLGAVVAAGLVAALMSTSLATGLVKLLQPEQAQPVALSQQDMQSLAPLGSYGDVAWQTQPATTTVGSAAEAARASGLSQLNPTSLPSGVSGLPTTYETVSAGQATFTFSAAKAQAAAAKAGRAAPQFPDGADGSTLTLQSGAGQAVIYGDMSKMQSAKDSNENPQQAISSVGTVLAIGEMKSPTVYSSGMSLDQLKQLLLSQPGLTPQAKQLIEGLGSPSGSLPIPFPVDQASAQAVTVQGVSGTMFGDNTGLGAGVLWIKGGVIHFVAGTVSQDQLLSVANGLR